MIKTGGLAPYLADYQTLTEDMKLQISSWWMTTSLELIQRTPIQSSADGPNATSIVWENCKSFGNWWLLQATTRCTRDYGSNHTAKGNCSCATIGLWLLRGPIGWMDLTEWKYYLQAPTQEDVMRLLNDNASRGFPGCLGSFDCWHWEWKNCPSARAAPVQGQKGKRLCSRNVLWQRPMDLAPVLWKSWLLERHQYIVAINSTAWNI